MYFSHASLLVSSVLLIHLTLSAQTSPGTTASRPAPRPVPKAWPPEVRKVEIPCSDGAVQPMMWYAPATPEKKPLLVGLHTWSSHYASTGGDAIYAEWCVAQGWAFVHPHFRGPNETPEAMGSDRAVKDVVEAVAWARQQTAVDESRIYLIGVSGGGHMALQMAGRHPELWAGVSAWCGISDIAQWHAEHIKVGGPDRYARNIESALGYAPAKDDPEAWRRSPLSSLGAARAVPLDISHGIHDGRKGSVPFIHSLRAFNAVAQPQNRLDEASSAAFYDSLQLPSGWEAAKVDPCYGIRQPIFRMTDQNVRVTIFQGSHEIVHQAALNWLAKQRKGQPVVWDVTDFVKLEVEAAESGK